MTIRLPGIYGYEPRSGTYKGLPGAITHGLVRNIAVDIYGSLGTSRNYLSIQTASRAVITAILGFSTGGARDYRTLNIANSHNLTTHLVLDILSRAHGRVPRLRMIRAKDIDAESHNIAFVDGIMSYLYSDLEQWSRKAANLVS